MVIQMVTADAVLLGLMLFFSVVEVVREIHLDSSGHVEVVLGLKMEVPFFVVGSV
jgi:hypothetical protein